MNLKGTWDPDEIDGLINIEPAKKKGPKTVGAFGALMMVLFWFVVMYVSPSEWLTFAYLTLTMGALALVARMNERSFFDRLLDNNWVAQAALAMTIVTGIASKLNPYKGGGLLKGWLSELPLIGGVLEGPVHPLADEWFWGVLNNALFGESPTMGWGISTTFYLGVFGLSLFISFTDEIVDMLKKRKSGGKSSDGDGGVAKSLAHKLFDEAWTSKVMKIIFGGGK